MRRADVYAHTRKQTLSVKDMEYGSDTYGTVVGHEDELRVHDARVVTYEGRRREAKRSGTKNVHAMFRGNVEIVDPDEYVPLKSFGREIRYDVARPGCFYVPTGETVVGAEEVYVCADGTMYGRCVDTQPAEARGTHA